RHGPHRRSPSWLSSALPRSGLLMAWSRCAATEASCALSCRVSSSTSTCPSFTCEPDAKLTLETTPGRSALSMTPCTGAMLPTASSVLDHSACCAITVVTASGGGEKDLLAAMAAEICRYFTKPRMAMTSTTVPNIWIMRLFMDDLSMRGGSARRDNPKSLVTMRVGCGASAKVPGFPRRKGGLRDQRRPSWDRRTLGRHYPRSGG